MFRGHGVDLESAAALLRRLFGDSTPVPFGVRLWDGRLVLFGTSPAVVFAIKDPQTFRRIFGSGDPAELGEAYVDGRMDVEGSLLAAIDVGFALGALEVGAFKKLSVAASLGVPSSHHSKPEDARDVRAHYDLSDEFFRLFLDERMVYSCAYFADPEQSLEEAQARKLDLVCRKLRLKPGERFLDIGCGWGALVLWAAAHYGVRATGVTLSVHQATEARRRVAAAGLTGQVTIEERHYADLPANAFDKIASVGMYEHVGVERHAAYIAAVDRALSAPGLFLNHGITEGLGEASNRSGRAFIFRHVFPGAAVGRVSELQRLMEACGFDILDVESLRAHYALTLAEWYRRFLAARHRAAALVPDRVLRTWDVYLAGLSRAFDRGFSNVHQVLAAKVDRGGHAGVPLGRTDLLI